MGWFFDQTAQAAAAHMTVGVAAAPVLCWPVIAAAAPPALAPPLPYLLPVAVAPAMVGPHFALPGPQMPLPRPEVPARPGPVQFFYMMQASYRLHVAPFAEQPAQRRNTATATRRAPTGTAMPNMSSRQQRIAGSRWRFTEAATSSAVEATLCSPATAQATQHQNMGGPFQPCELVFSRAIASLPYAYSTQVCCTGTGEQPCNALRGPYSGRGGGLILPGTPTSFQDPKPAAQTNHRVAGVLLTGTTLDSWCGSSNSNPYSDSSTQLDSISSHRGEGPQVRKSVLPWI
ncbi:uncharacterized protein LOC142817545 [Rhipicephalus microplus]|uniref:uncharacterized protein LOC142817545 n=1 Tax=Rhipicephalus microplus TaxID=6941 RepID=UPI003F6D7EDB